MPASEPVKSPAERMVRGLTAGGNRIRTIGPALAKGLSAVAEGGRRTDKLDGVIKHRSSRETTMVGRGASLTAVSFSAGPMVRIRLPPAGSHTNPITPRRCRPWLSAGSPLPARRHQTYNLDEPLVDHAKAKHMDD